MLGLNVVLESGVKFLEDRTARVKAGLLSWLAHELPSSEGCRVRLEVVLLVVGPGPPSESYLRQRKLSAYYGG